MRPLSVLVHLLLGLAILSTGCTKLNFFKRAESPKTLGQGLRVGTPAPEIDGDDFDGKRVKLSDYRGKVVVVTFWASWCKPCRELIPHEQALVRRFRGRKFALLGVNMDNDRDAALKVISSCGITWRNCHAGGDDNPIPKRWRIEALPTLCVIDAEGIVRHTRLSGEHLENAIETLLAEAEAKAKTDLSATPGRAVLPR